MYLGLPGLGIGQALRRPTALPATTTSLGVSPASPQNAGTNLTLTATVSAGATGSVSFYNGGAVIGTQTLSGTTAAISTTTLPIGSLNLSAVYQGDAGHAGSSSNVVPYVINGIASSIAITGAPASPTTSGTGVVFTGTVTATGSPGGTIRFQDGGVDMTGFTNPVTMSGNTASTPSITTLSVATHTITGIYSGDATHAGSTSAGYSHQVTSGGGGDTTTGLVGYWQMNDGSGTVFLDATSNHFDGTMALSTAWHTGYVELGGANYGTVPDQTVFNPGTTFTAFAWVRSAAGAQASGTIFAQYDFGSSQRSWSLGLDTALGARLRSVLTDAGASGNFKDYTGSVDVITDGLWHSVAMRWNAGTLDLFVDGVKDTSVTKTTDATLSLSGANVVFNSTVLLSFGMILNSGSPAALADIFAQRFRLYTGTNKTDADIAAMHALGHA